MIVTTITLDLPALRTFATGVELGGFARAAERLGRSTSAVSAQLRKLERQAGTPLVVRSGRGLALTLAGETMLAYARRMIDLNDEAVGAVRGVRLEGLARLGMQEDFGESVLTGILGRFRRAHPKVRIQAVIARNAELVHRVQSGDLDLALVWNSGGDLSTTPRLAEVLMCWIVSAEEGDPWTRDECEALPLAALTPPCAMRSAATDALDAAGVPWRMAFESPSLGGLWAATAAGLGVAVRTRIGLPSNVRPLKAAEGRLPPLPTLGLSLMRTETVPTSTIRRLAEIIEVSVRETVDALSL